MRTSTSNLQNSLRGYLIEILISAPNAITYTTYPFLTETTLYSGSMQEGTHSHTKPGLSNPLACNRFTVSVGIQKENN